MKYYIITSAATRHILPVTRHLLGKYGPDFEYVTIDLGINNINRWTQDIYDQLKKETDEYIIFSLDDYLPIGPWDYEVFNILMSFIQSLPHVSRYELGYGAQNNNSGPRHWLRSYPKENISILKYKTESTYRVSCQVSLWHTETLLNVLSEKQRTPWEFEVHANIPDCILYTLDRYAFRWIEESAISKRHPGKLNILGIPPTDVEEMIRMGLLDPAHLQYGMSKGTNPAYQPHHDIPIDPGVKYREFYRPPLPKVVTDPPLKNHTPK